MLTIVRSGEGMGADARMLSRLKVNHTFLHSNRADEIRRRVLPQKKEKQAAHILFDLAYALEVNEKEFLALLKQIRSDAPATAVTFYCLLENEPLISRSIEGLKELGYSGFIIADGQDDYLKQLNGYIIENGLHAPSSQPAACQTVGIMGGCGRIGTTTQAVQLLMFLQNNGYRAGLIQWHSAPELRGYVDVMGYPAKHLSRSEFVINDLHFYGREDEREALNSNDYLLFDYGSVETMEAETLMLYQQKDIRIIVTGVKPKENRSTPEISALDEGGGMKYLYSFVLQADKMTVQKQMGDRKKHTYFAEYTPDYFTYGGNNGMYAELLGVPKPQPENGAMDGFRRRVLDRIGGIGRKNKSEGTG